MFKWLKMLETAERCQTAVVEQCELVWDENPFEKFTPYYFYNYNFWDEIYFGSTDKYRTY